MMSLDPAYVQAFIEEARKAFHVLRHRGREYRDKGRRCIQGWEVLGTGYYGVVWSNSEFPGLVLKISGPQGWGNGGVLWSIREYGEKRLDAWPVFARHAKDHPHKNLPNILHFEQHTQSMAWAVMPKYSHDHYTECQDFRWGVGPVLKGGADGEPWLWPLRQMASGLHIRVDLHDENVMWDQINECPIITDPFSSNGE